MADDNPLERLAVAELAAACGHEVVAVADGASAWARYQEFGADVVISDWLMPGIEGPELCRRIRAHTRGAYTYVVMLTAQGGRDHMLETVAAGVDDHLTKPVAAFELESKLVVAQRVIGERVQLALDQGGLWERLRQAAREARTDPLTGLGNRLALEEELQTLSARSRRHSHQYWLAFADIDRFKDFNDRYGHRAGDDALAAVGSVLGRASRRADAAFRYGGEEFVVVLAEATGRGALTAAERLRHQIRQAAIPHAGNPPAGVVTISAGLARLDPESGPDAVLARADTCLYVAKRQRDNVVADRR